MDKMLKLPDGGKMPALGQGTWHMGDRQDVRAQEIESLRTGIELGMTLLDTAEMYGEGASEHMLGEAIAPFEREKLFLISKVYPWNADRENIFTSCENSLKRLGTDYLDLYLLHWPGSVPLAETVACMEQLVKQGKIRRWGVSNFDMDGMERLWNVPDGDKCAVDQVLYHLGSRGVEYDLLPWLRERGVPMMAYCPVAQGGALRRRLLEDKTVQKVAAAHDISLMQLLLAFVLHQDGVAAIPKAAKPVHTQENAAAADIRLSGEELRELNEAFPPPAHKVPLDIQ